MKSLSLKRKFILLWASILLIIASLGVVANYKASILKAKFEDTNRGLIEQDLLNQMIAECLQTGQAIRNIYIDPKDQKALENLGAAINNLDSMDKNLLKIDVATHSGLKSDFELFVGDTKTLYNIASSGKRYGSEQIIENTNRWREYKKRLKASIKASDNKANAVKKELEAFIFESITQMIIGILTALFLISLLLFGINRQILRSVKSIHAGLLNFFEFLDNKNVEYKKIEINSGDEFGEMAKALNENIERTKVGLEKDANMVKNAVAVANSVRNGHLTQRLHETPHNPQLLKLKNVLNDMLEEMNHNVANILSALRVYAQNDFTKRVDVRKIEAEMAGLMGGVNELGGEIEDMLGKNLQNGLSLKHSSEVLKNFVESLASSSNEQAASLEQTSAALEEITSNIGSNTEKAVIMAKKANEAKSATEKGEEMASKTVVSMQEIEKATNAINNAVAIIENIAFQTNILSLNAAVEAATAGDAGKGFAVVAQEVRNLAAKSAEAAKTIQALTNEAKNKAKDGTDVSLQMINGFRTIAEKIADTVDLVNDVTNANKEQMTGIEQINDAVAQLDQMTQENARVANSADEISNQVSEMAEKLTSDAAQKMFKNKESIIANAKQLEYRLEASITPQRQIGANLKKVIARPQSRAQIYAIPKQKIERQSESSVDAQTWESF